MLLKGSCHCGAVKFIVESSHPYPFNLCYCSICRKTAGTGGYAINISADKKSLKIEGKENIKNYNAILSDSKKKIISDAQRSFCIKCGTALWLWDPNWPELLHPHASAIDTSLPQPPESPHLMIDSKAKWVEVKKDIQDKIFGEYPNESIAEWHKRLGLKK